MTPGAPVWLPDALVLGQLLSHGVLALCSTLLLAAWMERALFFSLRTRRSKRPAPAAARGLYGAFAWIGGIAPMAGLLGTVTGIMISFADQQVGAGGQAQVMRGVGVALSATAMGLLLAMGAFSGRAAFGRRTEAVLDQLPERVA